MDEPEDTPAAQTHPAKIHEISTAEELVAFAQGVNSGKLNSNSGDWWVLTDDIDLSGVDWEPIGKTISPLSENPLVYNAHNPEVFWLGSEVYERQLLYFDGQGHTVSGLYCFETDSAGGFFFTVASGSIIRNLNVEGTVIAPSCGGLISAGNGLIENCSFTGTVAGYYDVGGLLGQGINSNGLNAIIRNCRTNAAVSGANTVGGMAGFGGNYINCYASGTVSGITIDEQSAVSYTHLALLTTI